MEFSYWGKAGTGDQWHNLTRHCVEVAAVARAILDGDSLLRQRLMSLSPLSEDATLQLLLHFACIHDLGKFSAGFQHKRPDLAEVNSIPSPRESRHHTALGLSCWNVHGLWQKIRCPNPRALEPLAVAAFCHHGEPLEGTGLDRISLKRMFGKCIDDALSFHDESASFFIKDDFPSSLRDESLQPLSWLSAGLLIISDWIGSSEIWFEHDPASVSIEGYWAEALSKAHGAVLEARILPAQTAAEKGFRELFTYLPEEAEPSPLQQAVVDLPGQKGPELLILEDLTGGGKTEAAVLAAHRAMHSGKAAGLFAGLPTMATANAIYGRMAETYRSLFEDGDASLVLAHGGRALNDDYLDSIVPMDDPGRVDKEDGRAVCFSWFADNKKKALLAPCGAGTIDQALLGVLSSRHQALRLLGLSRSFLVVDEVHAYDSFTGSLLANLLTFHAAMGGSAILLSATLPKSERSKMINAWRRGRELAHVECKDAEVKHEGFPLMTRMSDNEVDELGLESTRRLNIPVSCVNSEEDMFAALIAARESGACSCWIRNTVADALSARTRLVEELGIAREDVLFFHARFTGSDRGRIERDVLKRFGKGGTPEQRAGKILIATQVVEQSLDLDFDLLLSDLAPMELMIQRAGRCHRHQERKTRPEGYKNPLFMVLGPEPVDKPEEDWYANLFPVGRYVYRRPALLWRTARILQDKGRINLPEDARELVEGAYNEAAYGSPEALEEQEFKAQGEDCAGRSQAGLVALRFEEGYRRMNDYWDRDTLVPTRLGEASRQLRLIRSENGKLRLWADSGGGKVSIKDCMRSEVRVSCRKVDSAPAGARESELDELIQNMPDKARWSTCLILEKDGDIWSGRAMNAEGDEVEVRYGKDMGLEIVD